MSQRLVGNIVIALVATLSFFSVASLGPFILGDELIYSFNSRFISGAESSYGNWLYFDIYGATAICGDASYMCGKQLNVIFGSIGSLLLFGVLLSRIGLPSSLALALLLISGPFIPFVSMFMPEVIFSTFMVLAAYSLLLAKKNAQWFGFAASGSVFALAALIKPHGVLFIPAIILFFGLQSLYERNVSKNLKNLAYFIFGFTTIKLGLGFMLAGPSGLSLLGPTYQSALDGFLSRFIQGTSSEGVSVEVSPTLTHGSTFFETVSIQGPLLFVAVFTVFGPAVWFLISAFSKRLLDSDYDPQAVYFARLVFLMLLTITVAIVAFTGLVSSTGDDHIDRTLFRYVEVLTPLVLGSAAWMAAKSTRYIWPSLIFVIPQLVVLGTTPFWVVSTADSAYLRAIVGESPIVSFAWITFVLAVVILPKYRISGLRWLTPIAAITTVSIVIGIGIWTTERLRPKLQLTSASSVAAEVVSGFSGAEEGQNVHFVGSSKTDLMAAMLLNDMHLATIALKPAGQSFSEKDLPDGTKWVVSTQGVYFDGPEIFSVSGDRYKVSLVGDLDIHFFGKSMSNNLVAGTEGLSVDATNGQWIEGTEANVRFNPGLGPLVDSSMALQFYCGVDCAETSFTLLINGTELEVQGAAQGELVELEFALNSEADLSELRVILPQDLSGKVALRSFELRPRVQ